MVVTGLTLCKRALRKCGIIDPDETGSEDVADVLEILNLMADAWRTERYVIEATQRTAYNLVANQASYTIGVGGNFNQVYPAELDRWGVIPDDTATKPQERAGGRPLTIEEWALVPQKTASGAYPNKLFYDRKYTAGLGRIYVTPVPTTNTVDLVLYAVTPVVTSFTLAGQVDLRPGSARALYLNLAAELAMGGDYDVPDRTVQRIVVQATASKATLQRSIYRPTLSPRDPAISRIGHRRRGRYDIVLDR